MSTDPASGGYGSLYAPQGHADQLIDTLPGLGPCMSKTDSRVVAYELRDIASSNRGVISGMLTVEPAVLRTVATVLSTPQNEAMLCWGGVLDSYPPQCGGPRITNWDWTAVDHETDTTTGSQQRWGDYVLTGSYNTDGSEFTLTEPAQPLTTDDWARWNHQTRPDWSTPCPAPVDGWHGSTTTTLVPTSLPPDPPLITGLEQVPGYGGSWYDRTLDVENVRIVGDDSDRAAADDAIGALYDGPVCIVESTYTEAELTSIQHEIDERYVGLGPGPHSFITATWVQTDASNAAVVVQIAAPVPDLEAALHDDLGDAVTIERSYTIID